MEEDYFKVLYPDYDRLSEDEKMRAEEDRELIKKDMERIKALIDNGRTMEEAVRMVVKYSRADKYWNILYPDFKRLTDDAQVIAMDAQKFIRKNVETVEKKYLEKIYELIKNGITIDRSVMEETLRGIVYPEIGVEFTTREIGQATINAPTKAKEEAGQVETGEMGREEKEGEEVGDGN